MLHSIHNFFTAPTVLQKDEIEWLCKKGTSSSYFSCYVEAPIQGITALFYTCIDVLAAPVQGIGKACICLFQCSFGDAGTELIDGLEIGIRSLFQIAILLCTIVSGILFPHAAYSALQRLNATDRELETVDEMPADSQEDISRLEREVESLRQKNREKRQRIKDLKNDLEARNDEDLVEQLKEENLQLTQRIQQLQKDHSSEAVEEESTCGDWVLKGVVGIFSGGVGWQAGAIVMAWAPKLILDAAIANEGWVIGGLLTGPAIIKAAGPIIGLVAAGAGFLAAAAAAALIYSAIHAIQKACASSQEPVPETMLIT